MPDLPVGFTLAQLLSRSAAPPRKRPIDYDSGPMADACGATGTFRSAGSYITFVRARITKF